MWKNRGVQAKDFTIAITFYNYLQTRLILCQDVSITLVFVLRIKNNVCKLFSKSDIEDFYVDTIIYYVTILFICLFVLNSITFEGFKTPQYKKSSMFEPQLSSSSFSAPTETTIYSFSYGPSIVPFCCSTRKQEYPFYTSCSYTKGSILYTLCNTFLFYTYPYILDLFPYLFIGNFLIYIYIFFSTTFYLKSLTPKNLQ